MFSLRSQGLLPYACLGGALLALPVMVPAMTYPVSLVVVAAGIFEWTRRFRGKRAREDGAVLASTNPPPPDGPDPGSQLMLMHWRSSYECGHPVIDMQHRELFNISNEVINSVLDRRPKVGIEYLLHELVEHIKDHFQTEEEVLERTGYPALEEHRNIHGQLLGRATELEQTYREGLLPVADLVGFIAYDVIATHIIEDDLKFALKQR